jgi:hypothetical protein
MNNTYKIVGVRYPRYWDKVNGRKIDPVVITVDDKVKIKPAIEGMLFDGFDVDRMNYVLVKWSNKLYICEAVDANKREFVKSEILEHPYGDLC